MSIIDFFCAEDQNPTAIVLSKWLSNDQILITDAMKLMAAGGLRTTGEKKMNNKTIIQENTEVRNAPVLINSIEEHAVLHQKISEEITALEKVLQTENDRLDPSIELLSPTLRSVIRSRKKMLLNLNEFHNINQSAS